MNLYASFLGQSDPMKVIADTPHRLEELLKRSGEPEPGKWSKREIVCHLADCEIVFAYRIRQTLEHEHYVIQPFDQDTWASKYIAYDAQTALAVFSAVRKWNLSLIGTLSGADFSKPLTHPERGDMKLTTIVETMAGHDINHIRQMEAMSPVSPK